MRACGHGLDPVYDQVQDDLLHLAWLGGFGPGLLAASAAAIDPTAIAYPAITRELNHQRRSSFVIGSQI